MNMRLLVGLGVLAMLLGGCDDSETVAPDEPTLDCRNEGRGCGAGFECRQNGDAGYECLPEDSGTGGMLGMGGSPAPGGQETGGQMGPGGDLGVAKECAVHPILGRR